MIVFKIDHIRTAPPDSPFNGLCIATATVISAKEFATDLIGTQIEVVDHSDQAYGTFAPGSIGAACLSIWSSRAIGAHEGEPTPGHWATVEYNPAEYKYQRSD